MGESPLSSHPDVSVLIVSWNVSDLLKKCLETLKQYTKGVTYEIIVVDNASEDGSAAMVAEQFPDVALIKSTENLGFTCGNNRALEAATGTHILYLNPDIELVEDAISGMFTYLQAHADVGVVGPKLLNTDRSLQPSVGNFPTLANLWNEYFFSERRETVKSSHPDTTSSVDALLGAALLVRGDIVRELGGLDERFFMYLEETDLCMSLRELGLKTVYLPEVSMVHHGSKSSTRSDESRQRSLFENRKSQYLFFSKHYSLLIRILAWKLLFVAVLVRVPVFAVLYLLTQSPKRMWQLRYYAKSLAWLVIPKPPMLREITPRP